ncbi:unnamed protein product [Malus baccata var. baccata]
MSTSGIRFYDPKTTDMDLVQAMIHKGIVHDTFTDYVVKSENNDELAGKILAFIPSTEDLLAQIASCTHELDETDHASALEFTQELTKKCEEFGAPEMLKHCEVLKHKCIARDDVQSRESLVLLYEKYDILQHSLLRLLEVLLNKKPVFTHDSMLLLS